MHRILLHILVFICTAQLAQAQSTRVAALAEMYDDEIYSPYVFSGFLEKSLPIQLVFGVQGDDVRGHIYYGSDADQYEIEGTLSEEGRLELLEFDPDHRATGILEGNLKEVSEQFTWYSMDRSRQLSILLYPSEIPHQMKLYSAHGQRPVLIRSSMQQLSSALDADTDVRWIDYLCEGTNCYENRSNTMLYNPLEFVYNDHTDQEELMFYPDVHYTKTREGHMGFISRHDFDGYESYTYPIIGDAVFDGWVREIFSIKKKGENDEYYSTSDRLIHSVQGDFFVTLWTDDLISGYLYHQRSSSSKVMTLPFIFDIKKSKFYQVHDLFKKNFDYHFFIEKYVTSERRASLMKEPQLVKRLISEEKYKHFALTPEGLLFFTDFSVIYGRRYILIPYDEIKSSMANRTVQSYIKKRK